MKFKDFSRLALNSRLAQEPCVRTKNYKFVPASKDGVVGEVELHAGSFAV